MKDLIESIKTALIIAIAMASMMIVTIDDMPSEQPEIPRITDRGALQ